MLLCDLWKWPPNCAYALTHKPSFNHVYNPAKHTVRIRVFFNLSTSIERCFFHRWHACQAGVHEHSTLPHRGVTPCNSSLNANILLLRPTCCLHSVLSYLIHGEETKQSPFSLPLTEEIWLKPLPCYNFTSKQTRQQSSVEAVQRNLHVFQV